MADFRFKDLTVDNAFDFCEVLAVIGVEQVIGAFDKDEIQQLQESGTDMKEVGIVIAMKVCGILIKNISKARNEICKFFANCMEWDNGTAVTADDVKKDCFGRIKGAVGSFEGKSRSRRSGSTEPACRA